MRNYYNRRRVSIRRFAMIRTYHFNKMTFDIQTAIVSGLTGLVAASFDWAYIVAVITANPVILGLLALVMAVSYIAGSYMKSIVARIDAQNETIDKLWSDIMLYSNTAYSIDGLNTDVIMKHRTTTLCEIGPIGPDGLERGDDMDINDVIKKAELYTKSVDPDNTRSWNMIAKRTKVEKPIKDMADDMVKTN